jgi:hypothetical protein
MNINKLIENNELSAYASPSGRITYNKIVDKSNFGAFADIITDCVPVDIVNDSDNNYKIPSFARILPGNAYKQYLILNATIDEYMDYQDEEDQDNMSELLYQLSDFKKPIYGIAIQKSEAMGSAHAIAFITWKISKTKYKFAFYDPLAFKRGKKSFDYTDKAFVKERFQENIEFIDLNKYCFKSNELGDFHCSQYIINSEYCYMYSLYFLHKWLEYGAKLHRATFRKTIKSTYIVDPAKLSRANNKESMIYRIVMMRFICKSFLVFLRKLPKSSRKYVRNIEKNIKRIEDYLTEFKDKYEFDL